MPVAMTTQDVGGPTTNLLSIRPSLLAAPHDEIENQVETADVFEGIVGSSPRMQELFSRIQRVAPLYRTVLITGETGTGKDLVARAIHRLSPVGSGHFVVLNSSAVVETLCESELFGYVRGSFTGAVRDQAGLFEHAHGGTLFLDEIGDMSLATQAKLLRALENQEVRRVGALQARKVDVRVIAATNHDLHAAIAEKRFREDLFYRLTMVEIRIPPLVDRKEDLRLLQHHFLARFAAQYCKEIHGFTSRAQKRLEEHSWYGNVRELENVIGHAAMMTVTNTIDIPDLPDYLQPSSERAERSRLIPISEPDCLAAQEWLLISRALEQANGCQVRAARILRISRDKLRSRMKKYSLRHDTVRGSASAG